MIGRAPDGNGQTLGPPGDLNRPLLDRCLTSGPIPCSPAREELARAGEAAEARSDVDRVAEGGEVDLLRAPHHAHERLAGMHTDADRQTSLGQTVILDRCQDAFGRTDRSARVVVAGENGMNRAITPSPRNLSITPPLTSIATAADR